MHKKSSAMPLNRENVPCTWQLSSWQIGRATETWKGAAHVGKSSELHSYFSKDLGSSCQKRQYFKLLGLLFRRQIQPNRFEVNDSQKIIELDLSAKCQNSLTNGHTITTQKKEFNNTEKEIDYIFMITQKQHIYDYNLYVYGAFSMHKEQ